MPLMRRRRCRGGEKRGMEEVLQEDEMELTVNIEASEEILEARD